MTAAEQGLSRGDRYQSKLEGFAAWNLPPPWPDIGADSPGEASVWGVMSPLTKMLQVEAVLVKVSSWYHG